ncbi:MAG: hypothetical protein ACXAEU_23690 [Candidatus Hodarchaeales archaeon]
MTDLITGFIDLLTIVISDILWWYNNQLALFPLSIISYALTLGLFAIFLNFVLDTFKFLRNIVNAIFLPLRIVHVWFHVLAANKIAENRLNDGDINVARALSPRAYFSTGVNITEDSSRIGIKADMTIREAWIIASAPGAGSLFMIGVLAFLTPFLRTGLLGLLIHLYLFAGTALVMTPSTSDYYAVVHTVLVRSKVSPLYFLWSVATFAINFSIGLSATYNPLLSFIFGITTSIVYLFSLITVIVFIEPEFGQLNIIDINSDRSIDELERQMEEHFIFVDG